MTCASVDINSGRGELVLTSKTSLDHEGQTDREYLSIIPEVFMKLRDG